MTYHRRSARVLGTLFAAMLSAPLAICAQPITLHAPTPAPYSTTVGAHARYSKARINLAPPNLPLTVALVKAGTSTAAFDAQTLFNHLSGAAAPAEMDRLTKQFGAANVASFLTTFDFVIRDALAQANATGVELPAAAVPDPSDEKALAAALYAAGTTSRGGYDVEYMLDTLVSHIIHVQVMNDIDASPELGPKADANYHAVLLQLMTDLKSAAKV